jgi:hypothetical protein
VNETLSARRVGLLLRNDVVGGYRAWLIASAALAGLIVVSSAATVYFNGSPGVYSSPWWFGVLLLVWGAITASKAFNELHDRTKNEPYLLLPASTLEKGVARLLLVLIGFFVYFLAYATVVAAVAGTLNALLFGAGNRIATPFDPLVAKLLGHYVVVQSLFFVGAAWFRKTHFLKTVLALILISWAIGAFAFLLGWLLFGEFRNGIGMSFGEGDLYTIYVEDVGAIDVSRRVLPLAYFFALPLVCWYVAWLRIKETQVSHGV